MPLQCSSFTRLPSEIRLEIYRYLLLSPQKPLRMLKRSNRHGVFPAIFQRDFRREPNGLSPAILRTCRLVSHEAIDILYRENKFWADHIDDSKHSVVCSITSAAFLINKALYRSPDERTSLANFLRGHPNVEKLLLCFDQSILEFTPEQSLVLASDMVRVPEFINYLSWIYGQTSPQAGKETWKRLAVGFVNLATERRDSRHRELGSSTSKLQIGAHPETFPPASRTHIGNPAGNIYPGLNTVDRVLMVVHFLLMIYMVIWKSTLTVREYQGS